MCSHEEESTNNNKQNESDKTINKIVLGFSPWMYQGHATSFPSRRLSNCSSKGLRVSSRGTPPTNLTLEARLKSTLRDLVKIIVWGLDRIFAREVLCLTYGTKSSHQTSYSTPHSRDLKFPWVGRHIQIWPWRRD